MLFDLLFKKVDFTDKKVVFIIFFALLSAIGFFFWSFFSYVFAPKAQRDQNAYLVVNTTPLFQKDYLAPDDADLPDIWWWASQSFPDQGGFIEPGEYSFSAKVMTTDVINDGSGDFGVDVLLILEPVLQQVQGGAGESVFNMQAPEIFENAAQGSEKTGVIVANLAFNKKEGRFVLKSDIVRLTQRMRGRVFIRAKRGSGGVVDFVSFKNAQGEEMLRNNSFKTFSGIRHSRNVVQGWGAGAPVDIEDFDPYPWGYYFIYPVEIARSARSVSGIFINSFDLAKLRNVWVRFEKVFETQADTESLQLQISAFAPLLKGRGAQVWVACAGRDVSGFDLPQCVFEKTDGSRVSFDVNYTFGSLKIQRGTEPKEYKKTIDLPGKPVDKGPFFVRISANDGSELFVQSIKVIDASRESRDRYIDEEFSITQNQVDIAKRVPAGWSFGENYFISKGFSALDFVLVRTESELSLPDDSQGSSQPSPDIPAPTDQQGAGSGASPGDASPSPTADQPAGNQSDRVEIELALRFQGIRSKPLSGQNEMSVLISLRRFEEKDFLHKAAKFQADDNGVWRGRVSFGAVDGFVPGKYIVYVKGPKHIQRRICDLNPTERFPGSYKCAEGRFLQLQGGRIEIDLSDIIILAGDLPDQDGLVNAYDIGLVRNLLGSTEPEDLAKADVNLDGIVDITDFVLIQAALSVRYDEGEFINLDIDG